MKHTDDRRPCGGARPSRQPYPPAKPDRWNDPPCPDLSHPTFPPAELPRCPGGYLMQRILASGCVHRRRQCYPLSLNGLPEPGCGTISVVDAAVCAPPQWEEAFCRDALDFLVTVPLLLRVRDGNGGVCGAQSCIQERLRLYPKASARECWRGQMFVQAAVRLAGCAACRENPCPVPLEVLIEGFILAPSVLDACAAPACPPPKPWYPQPQFDPWTDR